MKQNIVLVGFMGVGKGRTARCLAEMSGMFALDCDDLIESYANKRIRKIFSEDGEPHFRGLEKKTAKWLEASVTNSVISTGGGFINVPNIRKIGSIVYLHSDFDTIIQSIHAHVNAEKKIKKRPLLQDIKAAKKLYNSRLPLYRKLADVEVFMADRTVERVAEEVIERVGLLQKK